MAIIYSDDMDDLTPESLNGFFADWETPPSTSTHLRMLQQSTFSIVAKDGPRVVGYLTALSDGVLFACISGIEVLGDYRGKNIGQELVRMALAHFKDIYAVDLVCEPALQPFYLKLGFEAFPGTCIRNNLKKSGVDSKKRVASLS
jgi:ribosomal protein S18 acetylase RimI-like enzyme